MEFQSGRQGRNRHEDDMDSASPCSSDAEQRDSESSSSDREEDLLIQPSPLALDGRVKLQNQGVRFEYHYQQPRIRVDSQQHIRPLINSQLLQPSQNNNRLSRSSLLSSRSADFNYDDER